MECSTVQCDTDDGTILLLEENDPIARKSHVCGECRREIGTGEKYHVEVGVFDGKIERYKTCLDCMSIRNEFFKEGFFYEQIKWMLRDHIYESFGDISESCISKLTPKAQAMVCDFINEYFENQYDEDE